MIVGELQLLVSTRRSAVKARTQAPNHIQAFLLNADDRNHSGSSCFGRN
jgi:hypothetical protein